MTDIIYDPTSRFQVLERPTSHPGKCRCCGSADRRVVDFGADDEEGTIYLCVVCVTEASMRFGTVAPIDDFNKVLSESTKILQENEKAGEYANELLADISFATGRFFNRVRGLADPEGTETSSPDSSDSGDSNSENSGDAEPADNKDSKPASKSRSPRLSAASSDSSVFKPSE